MHHDVHELLRGLHDGLDLFLFEVVRAQESRIDVGRGEELGVLDGPGKEDMAQGLGKVEKQDLVELCRGSCKVEYKVSQSVRK